MIKSPYFLWFCEISVILFAAAKHSLTKDFWQLWMLYCANAKAFVLASFLLTFLVNLIITLSSLVGGIVRYHREDNEIDLFLSFTSYSSNQSLYFHPSPNPKSETHMRFPNPLFSSQHWLVFAADFTFLVPQQEIGSILDLFMPSR